MVSRLEAYPSDVLADERQESIEEAGSVCPLRKEYLGAERHSFGELRDSKFDVVPQTCEMEMCENRLTEQHAAADKTDAQKMTSHPSMISVLSNSFGRGAGEHVGIFHQVRGTVVFNALGTSCVASSVTPSSQVKLAASERTASALSHESPKHGEMRIKCWPWHRSPPCTLFGSRCSKAVLHRDMRPATDLAFASQNHIL